jgi:hypothetical protein
VRAEGVRDHVDRWLTEVERSRWVAPIAVGLTVALLVIGAVVFWAAWTGAFGRIAGLDVEHYLDATRRWLETGSPYLPSEVAAPFEYQPLSFLHPPISLYLFTPFLWVPLALWWLIPLGVVVLSVASWRPHVTVWPVLALMLAAPRLHGVLIVGNTDIWVWAFVALGLRVAPLAWLVAIKPSLAVLVLVGAWDRRWWLGLLGLVIAAIPFGTLWLDWVRVVANSPGEVSYSLANLPWLALPIVAWLAATRRPRAGDPPRSSASAALA